MTHPLPGLEQFFGKFCKSLVSFLVLIDEVNHYAPHLGDRRSFAPAFSRRRG